MDAVLTAMDHPQPLSQSQPLSQPEPPPQSRWRVLLNTLLYPFICIFTFLVRWRTSPPDTTQPTSDVPATTTVPAPTDLVDSTPDTASPAFACKICSRRFGVQSNLNRHERKCAQKPVHNKTAATASTASGPGRDGDDQPPSSSSAPTVPQAAPRPDSASASSSTSIGAAPDSEEAMARETTNPAHRPIRGRRAPAQRQRTHSAPQPPRREGEAVQAQSQDEGSTEDTDAHELQPILSNTSAGTSSSRSSGSAGRTSVATVVTADTTPGVEGERRPKRRRRAPSPSNWVPASLQGFSLTPCREQAQAPLPPVRPHWDDRGGFYDERDSYAGPPPSASGDEGDEENVDPSSRASSSGSGNSSPTGISSAVGAGLSVRQRNFEYAPYHPCGWIGRLPGPAADITNYHHVSAAGPSGSGRNEGGGGSTYEFALSASV